MINSHISPTYKGKYVGILLLAAVQCLIGAVHIFFGLWLLADSNATQFREVFSASTIYNFYTLVFGLLTLVFAGALWMLKRWGWFGTVVVSLFVIVVDTLAVLNLPSIPGIPKFAAAGEIPYSIILVSYLSQKHVRTTYF